MTTLAFIGGGNMARALIGGQIARGADPRLIRVAEPAENARYGLAAEFGVVVHADNAAAAQPHAFNAVSPEPATCLRSTEQVEKS